MDLATQYWHKIRELESALHKLLRRISDLEKDNKNLRQENMELKIENAQLKKMLFGGGGGGVRPDEKMAKLHQEKDQKPPRPAASYRRSIPTKIDQVKCFKLDQCPHCQGKLRWLKNLIRYREDIPWPMAKIVTKEKIGVYRCLQCSQKQYGQNTNLHGSTVTLGPNVRRLMLYQFYLEHQTFQKIKDHLLDCYGLVVSDGEIQHILAESAAKLEPEHRTIRDRIRASPAVHMDETGWNESGHRGYAWGMMSSDGPEVSFEIADSRGKGVAEKMLGNNFSGTLVSDFYGSYKKLAASHQGCWVHLLRDFYELAGNSHLPKRYRSLAKKRYENLAAIYHELKLIQARPFDLTERQTVYGQYKIRLQQFGQLTQADRAIKKLRNLQRRIIDYQDELLVGLIKPGVPLHNNKAEQCLRQLVLKRKISFGSRSPAGCQILGINLSVLFTLWRKSRQTFFPELAQLLS